MWISPPAAFTVRRLLESQRLKERIAKLLTGMFGLQTKSTFKSGARMAEVWLFLSHDDKHKCEELKKA